MEQNPRPQANGPERWRDHLEELSRRCDDLERRLLEIENSRFFRLLRWPGRVLLDWRGRLGQLLLHSPFHALYLRLARPTSARDAYQACLDTEAPPPRSDLERRLLISIVVPVHNPKREWLEQALDSVRGQSYDHWELCFCDDASHEPWVAEFLSRQAGVDSRVRFVRAEQNLGIAGACNRAGELAHGEYIGFLDQDDTLAPDALYAVAAAAQTEQFDLIYSDEDRLDGNRRVEPIFKPAWSPDLLLGCMYMGHWLVVSKSALNAVGWLRAGFDGSQDYDLALRLTDRPAVVRHIPRVLYHWRKHAGSTAASSNAKPYTHQAGKKALADALRRRGWTARVEDGGAPNTFRIRWEIPGNPRASIVILSRNAKLLERCLRAIARRTAYPNREIVVVEHKTGSAGGRMQRVLEKRADAHVSYAGPFHFSAMNNLGAAKAAGDVLVFLNDDTEPLAPEWLEALVAQAVRTPVGVVGAQLVYPSGAIQHAGMAIGIMGGAGHPHRDAFGSPWWPWLPFTRNVSAVTGACLAIRKAVFDELGGFDPLFPVNYNDADLCLRARRAGYEVIYEPAALLRHFECRTRTPGVRYAEQQRWRERWAEWLDRGDPYYSPRLAVDAENASLRLDAPPTANGCR